jgi:hypothetical protein
MCSSLKSFLASVIPESLYSGLIIAITDGIVCMAQSSIGYQVKPTIRKIADALRAFLFFLSSKVSCGV